MIGRWSDWKRFPNATNGDHIEAPIGPGVYEVCHAATGEQVAFGYSANVAETLSRLPASPVRRGWPFFRRALQSRYPIAELEYRTCATGSAQAARLAAEHLLGQRQALIRRFSQRQ